MSLNSILCTLCLACLIAGSAKALEEDWSQLDIIVGDQYRKLDINELLVEAEFDGKRLSIEFKQSDSRTVLTLKYRDKKAVFEDLPAYIDLNSVKASRGAYQDVILVDFRAGEYFPNCKNTINGLKQSFYSLSTDLETSTALSSWEFSKECQIREGEVSSKLAWAKR